MSGVYQRHLKRPLDCLGAVALLAITAPLHAACAIAVAATSGRPIYFHQVRSGLDGAVFNIHKFRTMHNGTEQRSKNYPTQDMVTPIGRLLRRSSLDELPQLLNILVGEMSFVGPRPALPSQAERYTTQQRARLTVRPGITGLAQIEHRNSAPWSVRIDADRRYISAITLTNDLRIALRTIPSILRGEGQILGQVADDVDDLNPRPSCERL